jgi:hypothetical protein
MNQTDDFLSVTLHSALTQLESNAKNEQVRKMNLSHASRRTEGINTLLNGSMHVRKGAKEEYDLDSWRSLGKLKGGGESRGSHGTGVDARGARNSIVRYKYLQVQRPSAILPSSCTRRHSAPPFCHSS